MSHPIDIPEARLAPLNLRPLGAGHEIVWPQDANIFHMTLANILGT